MKRSILGIRGSAIGPWLIGSISFRLMCLALMLAGPVSFAATPPSITTQPKGQTALLGGTAVFSVAVAGTEPFEYQWQHNGTNITEGSGINGSTAPSLTLSNLTTANAGTYSVLVTNAYGPVASLEAPLILLPADAVLITFDDLPETLAGGDITNGYSGLNWTNFGVVDGVNATFPQPGANAGAVSPNNVAYSGFWAGSISSPSNFFTLYSAFLTAVEDQPYSLNVFGYSRSTLLYSNQYMLSDTQATLLNFNYSNVTSIVFSPTVNSSFLVDNLGLSFSGPSYIFSQPAGQSIFQGAKATFSVGALGSPPLSYQWQRNGVSLSDGANISGAATSALSLSNVAVTDAGFYSVLVSNSYGQASSAGVALIVCSLENTNLIVNGGFETGNFTSWTEWGEVEGMLVTNDANCAHSGNYGARLAPCCSYGAMEQAVPTAPGTTYLLSLWLTSQPALGDNYLYAAWDGVNFIGQSALGLFGWTNLQCIVTASATNTLLALDFQNGSGYFGLDDVSLKPILTTSPPILTGQPASRTFAAGTTATFTVGAVGTAPSYQWQMNGTNLADGGNISGSSSNNLVISNASAVDVGIYSVTVTNPYGTVVSASAALTVVEIPPGDQLVTFDDLPESIVGQSIGSDYAGLSWNGFSEFDGLNTSQHQPAAKAGVVSGNNLAISDYAAASITRPTGFFDFVSAYLTSVSGDGLPARVLGYAGPLLLYSNTYYLSAAAPTLINFNYTNVTQVSFNVGFVHANAMAMDNVVVSTNAVRAPLLTSQPARQSVQLGATATFSVSAVGTPPVNYQWFMNGKSLVDDGNVWGAATSQLTIDRGRPDNVGYYSVVVSDPHGSVTSTVAVLSVYTFGTNNLVQNAGFETGDFTAWTLTGDTANVYVATNASYAHSGRFGAQFGPYGYAHLSQTLPTVTGQTYLVSFWLDRDSQGLIGASWHGASLGDSGVLGWSNPQVAVTAIGSSSTLEFVFTDPSGYMGLDDVRVLSPVFLEPTQIVPVEIAASQVQSGLLSFSFLTLAGQSYTIQQTTNLATTSWMDVTNFTGSGSSYQFAAPMNNWEPRLFFRVREP